MVYLPCQLCDYMTLERVVQVVCVFFVLTVKVNRNNAITSVQCTTAACLLLNYAFVFPLIYVIVTVDF